MIADDRETTFEVALKLITAPVWGPIYFAYVGCRRLAEARARRKAKPEEPEVFPPVQPRWAPSKEFGRAVYAALILAGEPVNNRRLAEGAIRKARKGREVLISRHSRRAPSDRSDGAFFGNLPERGRSSWRAAKRPTRCASCSGGGA